MSIVSKKERKKERSLDGKGKVDIKGLLNPKRPHRGENVLLRNLGVPIPEMEDWGEVIRSLRQLANQDDASLSHVIRGALAEYYERHWPGNPDLILEHWTEGIPLSEAAKDKLERREYYDFNCPRCRQRHQVELPCSK